MGVAILVLIRYSTIQIKLNENPNTQYNKNTSLSYIILCLCWFANGNKVQVSFITKTPGADISGHLENVQTC